MVFFGLALGWCADTVGRFSDRAREVDRCDTVIHCSTDLPRGAAQLEEACIAGGWFPLVVRTLGCC